MICLSQAVGEDMRCRHTYPHGGACICHGMRLEGDHLKYLTAFMSGGCRVQCATMYPPSIIDPGSEMGGNGTPSRSRGE